MNDQFRHCFISPMAKTLGAQKRAEMAQRDADERAQAAQLRAEAAKSISQKFRDALEEDIKAAERLPFHPGQSRIAYDPLQQTPYYTSDASRFARYTKLYDDYCQQQGTTGGGGDSLFRELAVWLREQDLALQVSINSQSMVNVVYLTELKVSFYGARDWEEPAAVCVRHTEEWKEKNIVYC
jgi:hypothetical protein